MKYKCVGFERLAFSGFDLYIDDYFDCDNLFASGCIIFYKKDNLFHFVLLGRLGIYILSPIVQYILKDITENSILDVNSFYAYGFNSKEENRYLTNECVDIKPFYVLYEKLSDGNNLYCDCEKFCIGLERNQSLIFNSKKSINDFIKNNKLKSNFIKVDKLFKLKVREDEIRRIYKTNIV